MRKRKNTNWKRLITQEFKNYQLSEEVLSKLKKTMLGILIDFKKMCKELNIYYSLCGGTMLGAVRHKGFIPWDDDIDVLVKREDIVKIKKYVDENFQDKYILSGLEYGNSIHTFYKLCLVDTEFVEIIKSSFPIPKNIYIDLFPIDNIADGKISRKIREIKLRIRGLIFDRMFYKYPSKEFLEKSKENIDVKKVIKKINFIGRLSYLLPIKLYKHIVFKAVQCKNNNTKYEGVPSSFSYTREIFPRGFFDELIEADFEGEKFTILKNYKEYLTNLYGEDYMTPPPVEKREQHTAVRVKFLEE